MTTGRRVVVCIDGSAHSERAFDFYLANLARTSDLVFLTHVVEGAECLVPLHAGDAAPLVMHSADQKVAAAKAAGERLGYRLCRRLQDLGIARKFILRVGFEPPGVFICELVRSKNADIVVIGSRGQGVLRRTFLGSCSAYVLHHAKTPVCVVPPSEEPDS